MIGFGEREDKSYFDKLASRSWSISSRIGIIGNPSLMHINNPNTSVMLKNYLLTRQINNYNNLYLFPFKHESTGTVYTSFNLGGLRDTRSISEDENGIINIFSYYALTRTSNNGYTSKADPKVFYYNLNSFSRTGDTALVSPFNNMMYFDSFGLKPYNSELGTLLTSNNSFTSPPRVEGWYKSGVYTSANDAYFKNLNNQSTFAYTDTKAYTISQIRWPATISTSSILSILDFTTNTWQHIDLVELFGLDATLRMRGGGSLALWQDNYLFYSDVNGYLSVIDLTEMRLINLPRMTTFYSYFPAIRIQDGFIELYNMTNGEIAQLDIRE